MRDTSRSSNGDSAAKDPEDDAIIVLPSGGNFDLPDEDTPPPKAPEKRADAPPSVEAVRKAFDEAFDALEDEIRGLKEKVSELEAKNASYRRQLDAVKGLTQQLGATLE